MYNLREEMEKRNARPLYVKVWDNISSLSWWKHRTVGALDLWIRAHITQRVHWLRISDRAEYYINPDDIMERAILASIDVYLEKELGQDTQARREKWGDWGAFHRGYRVHFVGGEEWIDKCLEVREAHAAWKALENDVTFHNNVTELRRGHEIEKIAYDRLTAALVELMKIRGHLWT